MSVVKKPEIPFRLRQKYYVVYLKSDVCVCITFSHIDVLNIQIVKGIIPQWCMERVLGPLGKVATTPGGSKRMLRNKEKWKKKQPTKEQNRKVQTNAIN